jgi:phage terminase large subunit
MEFVRARIRVVCGGTSASKTVSIMLCLIDLAQSDKEPTTTSVVSESLPHLKKGAIKDFKDIMQSRGYWNEDRWNATDCVYLFETGSRMEFFGANQATKVRGPRRDRLFMNECNNIEYATFDQLEVRTKEFTFLDYNPVTEFWVDTELGERAAAGEVEKITLTYLDNEALAPAIVRSIESHRNNPAWWKVYGLGQLGEVSGRIYTGWKVIEEIPHEARLERRGLDFGFTNDPSAAIDIYRYNGGFILDEVFYQYGMSNRTIGETLKNRERVLTIGDSAEPKSIDEVRLYGVNIIGADKGPGSVRRGIQFVQDQRISITARSVDTLKEYRGYLWIVDKATGKSTNDPMEFNDHAMSAIRYGMASFRPVERQKREPPRRPPRTVSYFRRKFPITPS